jgi:hypothetical protein
MARLFNGTTDRLDWASVANLATSAKTLALWINAETLTTDQYFFNINNGAAVSGFRFFLRGAVVTGSLGYRQVGATDLQRYGNTTVLTANTWTHLLATHNGTFTDYTTVHIYLNGTEIASYFTGVNGDTPTALTGLWSVGGRPEDDTRNFDGQIAEVGLWNRVLTAAEIALLANAYSPVLIPNSLLFYTDLIRNTANRRGAAASTVDGTTVNPHPRVIHTSHPEPAMQPATTSTQPPRSMHQFRLRRAA